MAEDNAPSAAQATNGREVPQELSSRLELLESTFDGLPVLISYIGPDHRYRFNNRAYEHWVGIPRERLVGMHMRDALGPELYEVVRPHVLKALSGEKTTFEQEVSLPVGGRRYVNVNYLPDRLSDGSVGGVIALIQDFTDRKAAEEAMRESSEQLSTLADNIPVLCWMADADGDIFWYNRRWYEYTGTDPESQEGWGWQSVHDPEALPRVVERWKRSLKTGEPFEMIFPLRGADGEFRPFLTRVAPIRDERGAIVRWFGTNVDVSDRIKAEERLKRVLETDAVGVLFFNHDGTVADANDAFLKMTGYSRAEIARGELHWRRMTPEEWVPASEEQMRKLAATGRIGPYEKEYILADGTRRWMLFAGRDLGDGTIAEYCIDITDGKQAEVALREESHNLETLNRVGSALAGELDLEKVVQMVTDAGVELTGAQFGAFFYNVVNADGEAYMLYTLSGAERSQFERFGMPRNTKVFAPTFGGEGIVRSDDITKDPRYGQNAPHKGMPTGHLPVVSYLAVPVVSRTGEVIGGLFFGHPEPGRFKERHERLMEGIAAQAAIAIDNARLFRAAQHEIDQRMKAEQALTALNETLESRVAEEIERRSHAEEALRQAQKIESVGQLSGGIAHDFNNLLQVIHGNLTLLQRSLPADETKWQRSVANALTGTERAAALTRRLLAFSRRQPLDPRPIDVNRMIGDMTELLHRTLGETIRIESRLAADIPHAHVDANQLENAIINLAINARDAMPEGGKLEIETSAATCDEQYSTLHPEAEPGCYVRIAVRDYGRGMNADVLTRAVEPFFTTKEVGQGTGLGLSMVYGFVKQSGGHLTLHSVEGQGTTVELFLPCATAGTESVEATPALPELPLGRGERILVCEDDEDVRDFSRETLRDLGYEVMEAADAASALDALKQNGEIDLLFTDVVLPGGRTGADLAREARKAHPELKVLFTTGYARSALDGEYKLDPHLELLPKPFSVEDLANRLRRMLDA